MELHNEGANPEDANAVIVLVEFELLAQIQDDLLSCDNPKLRRLAADFGISGLDYIPQDILLEEGKASFLAREMQERTLDSIKMCLSWIQIAQNQNAIALGFVV